MKVELEKYKDKRICVAVSGGKDSMALLHYLLKNGKDFNIDVCALNCDHGMRGEASEHDSAFVKTYCEEKGVKLYSFKEEKRSLTNEITARIWRWNCYNKVLEDGDVDFVATAHHMNDNAETVLFNLSRGAALSGMTGITDVSALKLIRPLINCTREEIDCYIEQNDIPFVTDESNLSDDYTRNNIRHNVLPALEQAVPSAVENIFRFSRLAAEDEEYFDRLVKQITVRREGYGYLIKQCKERVVFRRAAHRIVAECYGKKDYTSAHLNKLFELQNAESGKKFEFLGLVAIKEQSGVAIVEKQELCFESGGIPFQENLRCDQILNFCGVLACAEYVEYAEETVGYIKESLSSQLKILSFDLDKIPETAVIRFRENGDKFTKFGGGTKSLSDYLTDKKVPSALRGKLPLVCDKNEVLIVGGVEISDKIKKDKDTRKEGVFICQDPFKMC